MRATNTIVPDARTDLCRCIAEGEIRSYDHAEALSLMEDVKQTFYRSAKEYLQEIGRLDTGAKQIAECFRPEDLVRITAEEHIRAYEIPEEAACIRQFRSACKKLNLPGCLEESFGGSDNNRLAEHGIFGRVLSCGMYNIHTVNECAKIHDMEKAAGLAAELITG